MIMNFSSYLGNFVCCSQSIFIELLIESKHSMPVIVDVLCVFFLHIFIGPESDHIGYACQ